MPERFRVRWSHTAEQDLSDILEYVARHEGLARTLALYADVRAAIEGPATLPRRGRVIPELAAVGLQDFREVLVGPYRICFRIDRRLVVLLGVLDGRRDLDELLLERAIRDA